jgi:guanylate kinase
VFVDEATFDAAVARGAFLEHATFLGHRYGTPWPEPPACRDVVLEIDVQGAAQVHQRDPSALLVFLLPPDREEQARRLRTRGDPPERVRERVAKAAEEEATARALGAVFVVNDDLERATREVLQLVDAARARSGAPPQ